MRNPEFSEPLKTEETYGLVPRSGPAEISGAPMESPNPAGSLEAADELAGILESVKYEPHRRRLAAIFDGLANGLSDEEILDELEKVEGKRINRPRLRAVYRYLRENYLTEKFPHIPETLGELRRIIEHEKRNVTNMEAEKRKEHLGRLSDEVVRLLGERQTEEVKHEEAVIEYMLGGRTRESLADAGLRTKADISATRKRVLDRLGIPMNFQRQQSIPML